MSVVEISLTKGKVVIDEADLPLVSKYSWSIEKRKHTSYARASVSGRKMYMHRLLLGFPAKVDHKDGNGLNNTRENLRPCTQGQNAMNARKRCSSLSAFKGVSFMKSNANQPKPWRMKIQNNGVVYRRYFSTEKEAAKAYDEMAAKLFGEFARTNA